MFQTENKKLIDVEQLDWNEARFIFQKFHPELVNFIDAISLKIDLPPLYKANYPFGTNIIKKSQIFLPCIDGSTIAFNSTQLPPDLIKNLNYDPKISGPIGMIINKNCEFYSENDQRIISCQILTPGKIFGIGHIQLGKTDLPDPNFMWDLMAGSRSIFVLPQISDSYYHNKLKKACGIQIEVPKTYEEHFYVCKDIAKKENSPWRAEVIYFSNQWLNIFQDKTCLKFYEYIQNHYNSNYRKILSWGNFFSEIEKKKGLANYPDYILDTAKEVFNIATGNIPGFRPAIDDILAPIELIQDIYLNVYGLKNKAWPIIMEPTQFSIFDDEPVYLSMKYSIFRNYKEDPTRRKGINDILVDLQTVIGRYVNSILAPENNYKFFTPSLYNIVAKMCLEYYHEEVPNSDIYENIKNNVLLMEEDNRFSSRKIEFFPKNSLFIKGCIKISQKL